MGVCMYVKIIICWTGFLNHQPRHLKKQCYALPLSLNLTPGGWNPWLAACEASVTSQPLYLLSGQKKALCKS